MEQVGGVRADRCPQRIPQVLPARAVNEQVFNGFGDGLVAQRAMFLMVGGRVEMVERRRTVGKAPTRSYNNLIFKLSTPNIYPLYGGTQIERQNCSTDYNRS